jgi:Fe-Mn family superoxide dismutase
MFKLPDLNFAYNALEPYIDEETMHIHHDGHHATYVKNINDALAGYDDLLAMDIEDLLKNLDKVPDDIRAKVKNNAGGHYHHSFFWQVLKPGGSKPSDDVLEAINKTFGDFDSFKEKFSDSATKVFGSGWTWLVLNKGDLEIINTPNQDSPISQGLIPLLALDLWEHAYYLRYRNKRIDFIQAFWNVVNWEEVQRRFQV